MADLDDALDELARVPPRGFGAARRAVAARLQQAGRARDAARVKALKAPAIPVWAINRLARDEPALVQRLVSAAGRVRAAQLGRGGGDGLAGATAEHGAALGELLARARAVLDEAGVRGTHRMLLRLQTTLAAAAADPERQRALRAGRLDRELGAQGFDVFAGARLPERRAAPAAGVPAAAPRPTRATTEGEQDAERAAREAERAARARELEARRQAAETAARELAEAREQLGRARERVRLAERTRRAADRALSELSRGAAGRVRRSARRGGRR
jgi:hypothetical protein